MWAPWYGRLPGHDDEEVQPVPGVPQVTATAEDPKSHHLYDHLQCKEDVDECIKGLRADKDGSEKNIHLVHFARSISICCQSSLFFYFFPAEWVALVISESSFLRALHCGLQQTCCWKRRSMASENPTKWKAEEQNGTSECLGRPIYSEVIHDLVFFIIPGQLWPFFLQWPVHTAQRTNPKGQRKEWR